MLLCPRNPHFGPAQGSEKCRTILTIVVRALRSVIMISEAMFKRLLVPLDGSRFASRALRYAAEVAQRFSAEVILIQVINPATSVIDAGAPVGVSPVGSEIAVQAALEADKRNVARAKRYLSGKVRAIRTRHIQSSYRVLMGDTAHSIIEFSEKENIDLVVMTTHGRSGLKRAVMGSIADVVIRESGKPVLVIRPQTSSKK
jgi:nucleotide-binding universal stress UspA family protein